MKLFLLAIAVTIISVQAELSEEEKQEDEIIRKEFQKESGLSDFEETPTMKQHLKYIFVKHVLINNDGDINIENLKERLKEILEDDEAADKVIEKCDKKKGSAEETAFHLFKCFFETTNTKLK